MNKTHLHNILNQYIEKYDELNDVKGNDEGYKWRAESCFKAHWNIDAEDFRSMFKESFKEMSNLIDNATVQPVGGILMLLNYDKEIPFVRECFRELFSEDDGNIDARQKRISVFIEKINSHIDLYAKGSWKYPQQRNNVIYYLNLWEPEENYIFKATEASEWATCVEFGDDFGTGASFSLKKYYKMCDELLAELKKNDVIMQLYKERMQTIDNFDDDGHILVYDVIYCARAYNLYKNVPTLKTLSTKQRMKLAETSDKREALLEKISDVSKMLETVPSCTALPDITGENVYHKKWGKGIVLRCNGGILEVKFQDDVKKLKYPDSINTFLTMENEKLAELITESEKNRKLKETLEKDLYYHKKELERLSAI